MTNTEKGTYWASGVFAIIEYSRWADEITVFIGIQLNPDGIVSAFSVAGFES